MKRNRRALYLKIVYYVRRGIASDIVPLVDVDFAEYRKRVDNRAVKKNCTLPYWMSVEADKAGINYSRALQDAIVSLLGLQRTH